MNKFTDVSRDRLLTRAALIGAATVRERSFRNTRPYLRNHVLSYSSSACQNDHKPAGQRQCAPNGYQRYVVCFFPCSVNRSDVDQLLVRSVREASPRKTEQAKRNQDDPKRVATHDFPAS